VARLPWVTVLMPVYNGERTVARAIDSLLHNTLTNWELLVIDDGSTDRTGAVVSTFNADPRITIRRMGENGGLGEALNAGLLRARGTLVTYLPADDVIYADHLSSLAGLLQRSPDAILAYAGVRHHYNRYAPDGLIEGYPLQLVQVMHRRTGERWLERDELVTDDLERMFWAKLRAQGPCIPTGRVTCEWVDHPRQRHKIIQEPEGGVNPYRQYYGVRTPLRFHSTVGNAIDEVERYRRYRDRPDTPAAPDGLKILLVGELAYNAERVLALEERGHRLYGLWTRDPYWYNTVGPLPFGHVVDLARSRWQQAIRELRPDIIYALLNWQAVPFAHEVLSARTGIPFVWHFKEGPFICQEKGTWPQLVDLYRGAGGVIHSSPEMGEWIETAIPSLRDGVPQLVLDGDLPKRDAFSGTRSPLLSATDGEPHTVVPGRPIGLNPQRMSHLAASGVHVHFYGDYTQGQWKAWIDRVHAGTNGYLHLHPQVDQDRWVEEFSQYDAGWLHFFESRNDGEIRRADWDDLNYPARLATLAVAGVPLLQRDNSDSIVATQRLSRERELGLLFTTMEELGVSLRDRRRMSALRESVWRQRDDFTFDAHADRLIEFFREVIRTSRGA
jgi:glycosyltransferase involved in cell wall biosynthesis